MSTTAHRVLAFLAMAALVALPIVSHSMFGAEVKVQLALTAATAVLANLGFTAIRPLADLGFNLSAHKKLAAIGTACGYLILFVRTTYALAHPTVALLCDIAIAVLGYAGVIVVKTQPQVAELQTQPVIVPEARTKDTGVIDLAIMAVIGAIGLIIAIVLSGCAPTDAYVTALKVKGSASDTLLTAYQAWRIYDGVHQDSIINGTTDRSVAMKELAAWRDGTQRKVDDAFVVARDAVTTYSKALAAADAAKKKDWGAAISNVTAAVSELLSTLAAAGIDIPKPSSERPRLLALEDLPGLRLVDAMEDFLEQLCADPRLEHLPLCIVDDEMFLAARHRRIARVYAEVR